MSFENQSLFPVHGVAAPRRRLRSDLGAYLVDSGLVTLDQMLRAQAETRHNDATVGEVLVAQGAIDRLVLIEATAAFLKTRRVDLAETPPVPMLMEVLEPKTCLKHGFVPWRREGKTTLIATCRPEDFAEVEALLPPLLRPARPVLAAEDEIQEYLARSYRDALTASASARVAEVESCRTWGQNRHVRVPLIVVAVLAVLTVIVLAPVTVFAALIGWACLTLVVGSVQKAASFLAFVTTPAKPEEPKASLMRKRPRISILVPLFREREVATALVGRLSRLTYPKSLLDVVLVLEETDAVTRDALATATLPPWMRIVVVPDGQPRTKPRAMNYALDFCRGDIIGIYDAEDAPDPEQLHQIANRFRSAPDDLVCLQGALDYYNPRQNWLARCFTIEYATWFRVMMPGMARLGFAIPLGGTTLFFRRDALEQLGGWDAHNVTEDADLGFRLARHGYRTEMIATTTGEEANCRPWPWVKQRSRWLKGYMVTYLVHMRAPLTLYRQLGAWKFLGFQTHFVTALSQFMLAPLLWSFWLILLGLPHPLRGVTPDGLLTVASYLFLTVEVIGLLASLVAVSGRAHRHLLFWVPSLHFYYPLGVLAAYKALYELVFAPFYWDKTQHGVLFKARKTPSAPAAESS